MKQKCKQNVKTKHKNDNAYKNILTFLFNNTRVNINKV